MKKTVVICAFFALAVWTGHAYSHAQAARRPATAPPFELPLINAYGYLEATALFSAHEYTFLVFWDSDCPHCVESLRRCEEFYEGLSGDEIAVVGVHAESGDQLEVEQLLESNGIFFPQLWDVGGEAGQNYGVAIATFTLFLVDGEGTIVAYKPDPQGDMKEVLEGMLPDKTAPAPGRAQTETAAPEETPFFSPSAFVFHGRQRVRFLAIDSRGSAAAGPYGEAVAPGNDLLYRFELEMSRRITRNLRVGGMLRISNEGEDVLKSGPKYLGSEWGSAFAEMSSGRFLLRIGYFDITMTPLTLMRWDWADNPRIGGSAGCGCGAAAGVLLVESLEELGPDLVFEGATVSVREPGFEARAFYAVPRRAVLTSGQEYLRLRWDRARYSLEIFGFEGLWRRSDKRTGSSWQIGVHSVNSWEDRRSVDFQELGYNLTEPDPWFTSSIVSAGYNIPLVRHLDLTGEWILWNEAREKRAGCACNDTVPFPAPTEGSGGTAGLVYERAPGWRLRGDYVRVGKDFFSPFAALSYETNREGFRLSAQVPLWKEEFSATAFYKRLRELQTPAPQAEKANGSFIGASVDAQLQSGWGGSVGWLDTGHWRTGDFEPVDEQRRAVIIEARYAFDRGSSLQAQFQRIENSTVDGGAEEKSLSNLYSLYLSARF